jgi:Holliday junction DNA helicase RuvB
MEGSFDIREQSASQSEKDFENALRPLRFDDFNGQDKAVSNLRIFVEAAKMRGEALDHTLLHGPSRIGEKLLYLILLQMNWA